MFGGRFGSARAVAETPKFHHVTPVLESLHWLTIIERISARFSLANKSLKNCVASLLTSAHFFHSHRIVLFDLLPLSPLVALLSPLVSKLQIYFFQSLRGVVSNGLTSLTYYDDATIDWPIFAGRKLLRYRYIRYIRL